MRFTQLFVVGVSLLAAASTADAQSETRGGSSLHAVAQLGLGGARASTEIFNTDLVFSGSAGFVNLEVGGVVSPGLVIYGKLYGMIVNEPDVEFGDFEGEADGDGSIAGLGVGIAHVTSSNLALSLALSASRIGNATDDDTDYESDTGPMLHFGISKTWPVSRSLGLGVGLEGAFGGYPDDDIDNDDDFVWGAQYLAVSLTARLL